MGNENVKISGKTKVKAKRKPVKPGRTMPHNVGGILNARVVARAKKKNKNKK